MTRPSDVDRTLEEWLRDGPSHLPDRVIDGIVRQLDQTHQRRPGWLPRRIRMNRTFYALGGAAAVVAVLAIGSALFIGLIGNRGSVGEQPTPSPTVQPTRAPTSTPAATPPPTKLGVGSLDPGRYFVDIVGYRYTFTVPATGWNVLKNAPDVIVMKGDTNGTDFANLWLWGPAGPTQLVWRTACAWTGTEFTPGPSVDDLATAIAGLTGFQSTQPTPTTVSGYSGQELKLTVPESANLQSCAHESGLSEYRSWDGRYYQQPGQADDVRVLDLDGHRTLVLTSRFAGTSDTILAEQASLFDSLEISPVPSGPSPTP